MDTLRTPGVTALAALGIVAGLVLLYRGLQGYRSQIRVSDTSTSAIGSMAAGEVRVSGRIEPAEMTLDLAAPERGLRLLPVERR